MLSKFSICQIFASIKKHFYVALNDRIIENEKILGEQQ